MTKTDILALLNLHGELFNDGTLRFSNRALNKAVDGIHAAIQKELGKQAVKKNTEYADPDKNYHHNPKMNTAIQDFIKARKELRKPITNRAVEMLMKKFKEGEFSIGECVEAIQDAIAGNYQGVFPKKKFRAANNDVKPEDLDYSEGLPTNK